MSINSKGFTLLELIIIISILGITVAFAAPGLSTMVANNRISSNVDDFVAALQFARSEAAAGIHPVSVCKRNAAGTGCVTSGDWQQGWIVFSDDNGDAAVDAGELILLSHEALDARITFGGTAGAATSITYQPSGKTSVNNTEVLVMCDDRGLTDASRAVLVTTTGRANVMNVSTTGQTACL